MHKNYYVLQIRLHLLPRVGLFGVKRCRMATAHANQPPSPFSCFESHYNLTAASLGFEHEQLTIWNIYYRKTEGQNMFATPTTSVQRARLLVCMLHIFASLIPVIEQTWMPRLPSYFRVKKTVKTLCFF